MIDLLILDRDGLINYHSSVKDSPFYYILKFEDLVVKPNVFTAFFILDLLRKKYGFKIVLATKQRCIGKGLITRDAVNEINSSMEEYLNFKFDGIYVEETLESKQKLYEYILTDYGVLAEDTLVMDDSIDQCKVAIDLGCKYLWTSDLLKSVEKHFGIS